MKPNCVACGSPAGTYQGSAEKRYDLRGNWCSRCNGLAESIFKARIHLRMTRGKITRTPEEEETKEKSVKEAQRAIDELVKDCRHYTKINFQALEDLTYLEK